MERQNVVYIRTVGYYSVIKRNKVLKPTTIWMNSENMLREISQTQKNKHYIILLIRNIWNRHIHRGRKISGCSKE